MNEALTNAGRLPALLLAFFGCLCAVVADDVPGPQGRRAGPYFIGYETEPAMDYGGRMLSSLDIAVSDLGGLLVRRMPPVAAAYEVPLAAALSTIHHEFFGHGGRGREFGLQPTYGIGSDLGAYTALEKDPETVEQAILLSGAGTEAGGVLADRIARGLRLRDETPASLIPLMFIARIDLSVYAFSTSKPVDSSGKDSFGRQFEDGNDIANYLVGRQAQRNGVSPSAVWNEGYEIDYEDGLLLNNWEDVRQAALWNIADPMLWASMVLYAKDHLIQGRRYATPPAIPLGGDVAVSIGTRAALDPQCITRFLDLYVLTGAAGFRLYGRDLDSSGNTTYGGGGEVFGVHPISWLSLRAGMDFWANPESAEALYTGSSWNILGEIEIPMTSSLCLSLKSGRKSDGFLPGTPAAAGQYWGGGLSCTF